MSPQAQSSESAGANMPQLFQEANDLLELLGDADIWEQLVNDGLARDAQGTLGRELAKSRSKYRAWRAAYEGGRASGELCDEFSPSAAGELDRIVSTIRSVGSHAFCSIGSLRQRFASTAAA